MTRRNQKMKSQSSSLAVVRKETNMSQKKFDADLWIVVKPAVDVPGTWVSHCLTLDLMSQGNSPEHALEMIFEVTQNVVVEDLLAGRDPASRGAKTPDADWAELSRIVQHGTRFELSDKTKPSSSKVRWAVNMKYLLEVHQVAAKKKASAVQQERLQMEPMPPAWKIAASGVHASHVR